VAGSGPPETEGSPDTASNGPAKALRGPKRGKGWRGRPPGRSARQFGFRVVAEPTFPDRAVQAEPEPLGKGEAERETAPELWLRAQTRRDRAKGFGLTQGSREWGPAAMPTPILRARSLRTERDCPKRTSTQKSWLTAAAARLAAAVALRRGRKRSRRIVSGG